MQALKEIMETSTNIQDLQSKTTQAEWKVLSSVNGVTEFEAILNCKIHGDYKAIKTTYEGAKFQHITECPECFKESERLDIIRRQEEAEKERQKDIKDKINRADIPLRFKDCSFDNFKDISQIASEKKSNCKKFAQSFERGASLILCGTTGVGKTHLAISILKEVITKRNLNGYYTRVGKMIDAVKETYSNKVDETKTDVINRFSSYDLLILDEVGVQHGTDAEKVILFEILNERYERMKSTILIGNLDIKGFTEFVGERIIDRMKENGGMLISMNWQSYRG